MIKTFVVRETSRIMALIYRHNCFNNTTADAVLIFWIFWSWWFTTVKGPATHVFRRVLLLLLLLLLLLSSIRSCIQLVNYILYYTGRYTRCRPRTVCSILKWKKSEKVSLKIYIYRQFTRSVYHTIVSIVFDDELVKFWFKRKKLCYFRLDTILATRTHECAFARYPRKDLATCLHRTPRDNGRYRYQVEYRSFVELYGGYAKSKGHA